MIVVTGAGGFIGSNLIKRLNDGRFFNLIAVDKYDKPHKENYLKQLQVNELVDRDEFPDWLDANADEVEYLSSTWEPEQIRLKWMRVYSES